MRDFDKFQSETYGELDFDQVVAKIEAATSSASEICKVIVGSDSHPENHHGVRFVTAIALVKEGRGGIYFWMPRYYNFSMALDQRMIEEAWLSVDCAMQLRDRLGHDNPQIEIHADVSSRADARSFSSLSQVKGLITGSGFVGIVKPDAFVASKVADRHT